MTDVIVAGCGPAGVAAAVQLARSGIRCLCLDPGPVGGLLHHAHWIENFPGIADGITGADLAARLESQLRRHGLSPRPERVTSLRHPDDKGLVVITDVAEYPTRHLIWATGTLPKKWEMDLPGAASSLIFDDPRNAEGFAGPLAILGGGDAAFDYALRLASRGPVHILHRGKVRSLPRLVRRAEQNPAIAIHDGFRLRVVEPGPLGLRLVGGDRSLDAAALLLAIGRTPALAGLGPDPDQWRCHPSVHFAGDVVNGHYRQAAIAAGDGLRTAMRVAERIK